MQTVQQLEEKRIGSDCGIVVHFMASWHKPCQQVAQVLDALAKTRSDVDFLQLDAEQAPDISRHFHVDTVPTVLIMSSLPEKQKPLAIVRGPNIPLIVETIGKLKPKVSLVPLPAASSPKQSLKERIESEINAAPVVLFMKGDRDQPRCGFSSKMIELLNNLRLSYATFDILEDEEIRQGLKTYSNWPTFPQLYVEGKLVGGLDVVSEMIEEDEFEEIVAKYGIDSRLKQLINSAKVMLFMKGDKDTPKCGFSSKMVGLLQEAGCSDFSTFDILEDPEVRRELKVFSKWPTFPQLYIDGQLIGGLDIAKELFEEGDLQELLA